MRFLFIINPAAGAGRAGMRWKQVDHRLQRSDLKIAHVFTKAPGEAALLSAKAAGEYEVIVAVGGDGTAAEVASGLVTSGSNGAALGILPFGTGNDLAEVLGIKSSEDALRCLAGGHTRQIDVLRVQCEVDGKETTRYALLFAGVGIISAALRKTTPGLKRLLGQRLAYPAGLLRALAGFRSPRMIVLCDQERYSGEFLFAGASNTPIAGGGMKIAPSARIDDGVLDVNLIGALSPFRAIPMLRRVCRGLHLGQPVVRYFSSSRLEITSDTPLDVAADGELIGQTPVRISVLPSALRVITPTGNPEAR
ncbi:MAG TPA: diacylglycerol kinase family protein [Verrucomicrobiae bacterium]|nr:diacylglycerol kinase family protein [Verrucomicrobiae bacterium]